MRLMLCGDLVPTASSAPLFDRGDCEALMGDVLPLIHGSDYAVANLECALTDREQGIRKCGPCLKGRPEHAGVIARCGFTHLGLSNNHMMDFGAEGTYDTMRAIQDAGMIWFGAGEDDQDSRRPLLLELGGECVAIVAVCEHEYSYALPHRFGANPFDPFDTMEDIALAAEQADRVIVMYHGGKEQCEYPSPRLRKACRAMVRAGADLVLCQHSHCIGCHESYRGGQIVYGQGNFHFVKYSDNPQWQSGLAVAVRTDGEMEVEFLPVVTSGSGIRLAQGEEKEAILSAFEERSRILLDEGAWMTEWERFCRSVPYYVAAMRDAFTDVPEGEACRQVFPHYLDCEAHLDVLHTLFKTWHWDS